MDCIFCRIINRELPAKVHYETHDVLVISDKYPKDKVHLLVIPKAHSRNFFETSPEVLDLMNRTVKTVVEKLGITDHFRVVINNGYGQEIDHVHFHILSNRRAEELDIRP